MFYTFRHLFFGGLYLRGKPVKTYNHLNLKTLISKIQSKSTKIQTIPLIWEALENSGTNLFWLQSQFYCSNLCTIYTL